MKHQKAMILDIDHQREFKNSASLSTNFSNTGRKAGRCDKTRNYYPNRTVLRAAYEFCCELAEQKMAQSLATEKT